MSLAGRPGLSRRDFLRGTGSVALTLSLGSLVPGCGERPRPAAPGDEVRELATPSYGGWKDLYRVKWTWDRIAKGTHHVNCWYQRGCSWNVYVKDGLVLREEQVAAYPQTNASVPDFNPRGCQKGACYSDRMYDPSRLTHPLKRVGSRGEGKWKRVKWGEALDDIADKMIDSIASAGPAAICWEFGTSFTNGCHGVGVVRTNHVLDSIMLDDNAEIGDHHPGAAVTTGKICFASSADDWFNSDLILIWGGNPVYTQIPNAHFFLEARYNGAQLVTIAPDYSPSSFHSDLWVPVEVGTDAALGLGLAQVIVEEGLYDGAFLREQTDMALLVRKDNRRFLRESDFKKNGSDDVFYCYDGRSGRVRPAPRRSLALKGLDPLLEGEFRVATRQGEVVVTPVFAALRERLREYSPETVSRITGTHPEVIRRLARDIAGARAATILTQSNFSKFYHGMEMERVQLLVLSLCGHIGKKGAGMNAFPWLTVESPEAAGVAASSMPLKLGMIAMGLQAAPGILKARAAGKTMEMYLYERTREEYAKGGFIPSVLYYHKFGGLNELSGSSRRWDPHLERDLDSYLAESLEKGWQIVPDTAPQVFLSVGGNFLRRVRGYHKLIENFLPKLKLLVSVDWRMSNTALHSDYVLPATGWYERDDITWATPHSPFIHVTTAAAAPLAEAKTDWEFHCLLMKHVQQRALDRGITTFEDRAGKSRRLDRVYDELTFNGRYGENDTKKFLTALLEVNTNLGGASWDDLERDGFARFTSLGTSPVNVGNATDIEPHETITANTWYTEKKHPWPTLTRRIQFYIDQERFFELGEELPVHKDNPAIGGNYPLKMTGGHARWSIHASWRDSPMLLRLQRGEPVIIMNDADARERGVSDGDEVRVRNDTGEFSIHAKLSAAVRRGQVMVYHAWEPFQFKGGRSHQSLVASPINPIQLVGGYYHLQPMMIMGEPGQCDRGTRVEVEKA